MKFTFNDLHLATRFFSEMLVIFTLEMSSSDNSGQCFPGRETYVYLSDICDCGIDRNFSLNVCWMASRFAE